MTTMLSQREVAEALQLSVESTRALSELLHGVSRDLFSADDVAVLRAAKERLVFRSPRGAPGPSKPMQLSLVPNVPPTLVSPKQATITPRDAETHFSRAVAEEESGELEDALQSYLEAVAANPLHADAHVNVGRLLHQMGRLAEAEAHTVAALVSRPDDATATFNLAVVLDDLGRVDEAIARYQESIALDPRCVDAYFNLARLYESKGEKVAAIRHLKDYRRLGGR